MTSPRARLATPRTATATALLGTAALGGLLAGCAPATASGGTTGGPYTDGTYTASGDYVSPHGPEQVDVTLTLANDIVESVTVVGHGDNPDSQRYQGFFVDGIAAEVVGKDIDTLDVHKVGGSSLTSGGFNQALEKIKAEAAS